MLLSTMPIVKTTSLRESVSADASQPKAMAIIRGPVRLPGRRREAIRPAIANAQTTGSPNATYMSPFACTRVVASTWVTPTVAAASASTTSTVARRPFMPEAP